MQFIEREIKEAGRLFEPSRVFLDSLYQWFLVRWPLEVSAG